MKNRYLFFCMCLLMVTLFSCAEEKEESNAVKSECSLPDFVLYGADIVGSSTAINQEVNSLELPNGNSQWIGINPDGYFTESIHPEYIDIFWIGKDEEPISIGRINEPSRIWIRVKGNYLYYHTKNRVSVFEIEENHIDLVEDYNVEGYVLDFLYIDNIGIVYLTGLTVGSENELLFADRNGNLSRRLGSNVNGFEYNHGTLSFVDGNGALVSSEYPFSSLNVVHELPLEIWEEMKQAMAMVIQEDKIVFWRKGSGLGSPSISTIFCYDTEKETLVEIESFDGVYDYFAVVGVL